MVDLLKDDYRTFVGALSDVANTPADLANLALKGYGKVTGKGAPFQFGNFNVPQPSSRSDRILRAALPYATVAGDVPTMARNGMNMLMRNKAAKVMSETTPEAATADQGRRSFLKGSVAAGAAGTAAMTLKPFGRILNGARLTAEGGDPTAALVRAHLDAAKSHEIAAAAHSKVAGEVQDFLHSIRPEGDIRHLDAGGQEYVKAVNGDILNGELSTLTADSKQASMRASDATNHDLLRPEDEIDLGLIMEDEAPDLEHLRIARRVAGEAEDYSRYNETHFDEPISPEDIRQVHEDIADKHASASYAHVLAAHKLLGKPPPTAEEAIAIRNSLASPK